jgi:hypothetical protein
MGLLPPAKSMTDFPAAACRCHSSLAYAFGSDRRYHYRLAERFVKRQQRFKNRFPFTLEIHHG